MADFTNVRQEVAAELKELYAQNARVIGASYHAAGQPNQALRAVLVRTYSIGNACLPLLNLAAKLVGYRSPIRGLLPGQIFEQSGGLNESNETSAEQIKAAVLVVELANLAHSASEQCLHAYKAMVASAEQGTDLVQPPLPVIDAAFDKKLACAQSFLDATKVVYEGLAATINQLKAKQFAPALVADNLLKAAQSLISGLEQDLQISAGQPPWEKEPAAETDESAAGRVIGIGRRALRWVTVNLYDVWLEPQTVGTRAGFLDSTEDEYELAHIALNLVLDVLLNADSPNLADDANPEVPVVEPCLIAPSPGGVPAAEPATGKDPPSPRRS